MISCRACMLMLATSRLIFSAETTGPDVQSALTDIRPAIVRVGVTFSFSIKPKSDYNPDALGEKKTFESSGTGFIVNTDGLIATANHVVDKGQAEDDMRALLRPSPNRIVAGSLAISKVEVSLFAPNRNPDEGRGGLYNIATLLTCAVLKTDTFNDIALLKCNPSPLAPSGVVVNGRDLSPPRHAPKFDPSVQAEGEMICVSGFPLNLRVLVTNIGFLSTSYFVDEQGRSLYLADMQINHGNSGGPVYRSSDGAVIGMAIAYRNTDQGVNSGVAQIVPIRRVLALLGQ